MKIMKKYTDTEERYGTKLGLALQIYIGTELFYMTEKIRLGFTQQK